MAAKDPAYDKLVISIIEQKNEIQAEDDLVEPLETLESHMSRQLMKRVATLSERTTTKKAGRSDKKRGTAHDQ